MSEAVGFPELLDAVGYNYQEPRYAADHQKSPARLIYGSENSHQYAAWLAVRTNDFVAGQFLWTGIDYLGEAGEWPNRGSSAGLLDLCGFKKPLAWFRQSLWSDQPMVYLCVADPNRGFGRRGFKTCGALELAVERHRHRPGLRELPGITLTLNDRLIGTQRLVEATNGMLRWTIPYEPGVLKAVGRNEGKIVCEYALRTASPARRMELLPDTTRLQADGKDICHLEFRVVDDRGVRVPNAELEVTLDIAGPANLLGMRTAT